MPILLPSSRASLRIRLSPVDVALAAAAPLAALYLRDVALASYDQWVIAGTYSLLSLVASLVALQVFGISDTIPRYISVRDLLEVAKVVVGGQLVTTIVLFTVTRLDGIPRSLPTIQALILGAGLVAYRGLGNLSGRQRRHADRRRHAVAENVIFIGLNDWSVLVMRFLKARAPERWRIIALLDEEARWIGRSVNGVQIFGPPTHLEAVIEEFAMHGVRTDRVIMASDASEMSKEAIAEVKSVCARRNVDLVVMPDLLGLGFAECAGHAPHRNRDRLPSRRFSAGFLPSPYWRFKRLIDVIIASISILALLPLLAIGFVLVVLDVGWPVFFWQQRVGRGGTELQIYKLRTLRPPFDRRGQKIPEEQRLSWIGRLLRQSRIDELPQLLNVLLGEMSLIGPRPLLPRDQPPNSATRLMVRPGITGWAQVNGGINLSTTEKDALDVWYIYNASLSLDLRIIGMTLYRFRTGDRRSEKALAQAQNLQSQRLLALQTASDERGLQQTVASRFGTALDEPPRDDGREAVAMQSR